MIKRVFVAINLPDNVKEKLAEYQDRLSNLPVRWIKKNSLHITVCFIGDVDNTLIKDIKDKLDLAIQNIKPFKIYLNKVHPGPLPEKPRMVWVSGPTTEELKNLYKRINEELKDYCKDNLGRGFILHLTLGRATHNKFGQQNKIRFLPEDVEFFFDVKSIELMESSLLKDGAEYSILKSFSLP